jgi:hypothetical protein
MLWFLVKFWDTELYEGKQEESQILIDYLLSYILPEFQRNKSLRELSIRCNAFLNGLLELHLSIPFPPLSGLDVFGERPFPKEKAPAKPTTPKPPTAKPPQKTTPPPKTLVRPPPSPEAPVSPPRKQSRTKLPSVVGTKGRQPQIQQETQPTEEEEPTEEPQEEETPEEEKPEEEEVLGALIGEGNIIYPLEWEKGEVRFPIWWSRADILTPRFFKVVLRDDPLHNALLIRSKKPGSTNMYIIPPPPR